MTNTYKRSFLKLAIVYTVFFLMKPCYSIGEAGSMLDQFSFILEFLMITGVISYWVNSVRNRITHDFIRHYLYMMAAMMVFWMMVRTCKYRLIPSGFCSRMLWYIYYIPMILLPLWGFLCALCMGKREDENIDRRWKLLYLPAAMLILTVMTNDLHQLVFNWGGAIPIEYEKKANYVYGPGYFAVAAWMAGLSLTMILFLFYKCRVPESKSIIWLPMMVIPVGAFYSFLYAHGIEIRDVTIVFCFLELVLMESVIDSGLILSSNHYKEILTKSSLDVVILDKSGRTSYRSGSARDITPEEFRVLQDKGYLDKGYGHVIRMKEITGGYVVWVKEPDRIKNVINELMDIEQELKSNSEMLSEELKVKRHKIKLEEQMRLYRMIASYTKVQYDKIGLYLKWIRNGSESERRALLAKIALLGAFIKRESNLVLLAETNRYIASGDLKRCFEETLENLKPFGVDYALNISDKGQIDAKAGVRCYEYVESILENIMDNLSILLITVENREQGLFCSLRYQADGEEYLDKRCFPGKGEQS